MGVIYVFDITNPDSFDSIKTWDREVKLYSKIEPVRLLVGNKSDLHNDRKVEYDFGSAIAESLGMKYFETSAKISLESVETCFKALATKIHEKNK